MTNSSLALLAEEHPDRTGWVWPAADPAGPVERWTFASAAGRVGGVVAELAARRLAPGDRIGVVGGNHRAWVLLREAASVAGLVFVPVGSRLAPPERDWILRNAEVRAVLGDPGLPPGRIPIADWNALLELPPGELPAAPRASDAAQLLYTSGSSGRPKGVLRPRSGDEARILQSIRTFRLRPSDVNLVAGPLYHSGPAIFHSIHRAMGAEQWVLERFDAARVADLVCEGPITNLFMVPTMWRMLLEEFRRRRAVGDGRGPRLRVAWTAGSSLEVETRLELLELLGEGVLWEFYGTTETGTITILPPEAQRSHAATVGFAVEGAEIRVVDDAGRDVAPGEPGRVYVKSPTLMIDYHRGPGSDPDLEALRLGDWLSVRDRGRLHPDGALELHGREGGMIITGGINVYPEEVEAALRALDGVREAVVFGAADPTWGRAICALVEPLAGRELEPSALAASLEGRIAHFKVPKRWTVGPIPRTPSEKVIRDESVLAELLGEGGGG